MPRPVLEGPSREVKERRHLVDSGDRLGLLYHQSRVSAQLRAEPLDKSITMALIGFLTLYLDKILDSACSPPHFTCFLFP